MNNRTTFPELNAKLRTDSDFINKVCDEFHNEFSPLETLDIGMISGFPLDYMHLVCLGLTKKKGVTWTSGRNKACRLSSDMCANISRRIARVTRQVTSRMSSIGKCDH